MELLKPWATKNYIPICLCMLSWLVCIFPRRGYYPFLSVHCTSVQLLSHVWLFATPWTAACQASLSITNSQSLLKLMSIESVMPSNHRILSSPSPAFNFSNIMVFSNESVLHIRWPKYCFSFSISPSNEYS